MVIVRMLQNIGMCGKDIESMAWIWLEWWIKLEILFVWDDNAKLNY